MRTIDFDDIRRLALSLPQSAEVAHFNKASFRVNNKIFAVLQEDGITVTVRTAEEDRTSCISMDPETFRVPESFSSLNYMHVDTRRVDPREMKGLLIKAWASVAPKKLVKEYNNL